MAILCKGEGGGVGDQALQHEGWHFDRCQGGETTSEEEESAPPYLLSVPSSLSVPSDAPTLHIFSSLPPASSSSYFQDNQCSASCIFNGSKVALNASETKNLTPPTRAVNHRKNYQLNVANILESPNKAQCRLSTPKQLDTLKKDRSKHRINSSARQFVQPLTMRLLRSTSIFSTIASFTSLLSHICYFLNNMESQEANIKFNLLPFSLNRFLSNKKVKNNHTESWSSCKTNCSEVVTKPSSVTGKKVNSKWKKKHQMDHSSRYGHGASYLETHPSRIALLLAILMAGTLIFSHQMSISNIIIFFKLFSIIITFEICVQIRNVILRKFLYKLFFFNPVRTTLQHCEGRQRGEGCGRRSH